MSGGSRKKPQNQQNKPRSAGPAKGKASGGKQNGGREFAPVAVGFQSIAGNRHKPSPRRETLTEYVGEINGSVAFAVTAYPINPGQVSMFPWLSPIASRFEKYEVENLRYHYRTEKSSATSGTVMFAVDYDATDALPTSKAQLLQNEDKERKAPWQEFVLQCSKHSLKKTNAIFVRPGLKPGGTDLKTYDLGQLLVATQGMADTSAVGELWVEYDITLDTPVLESAAAPVEFDISLFRSTAAEAVTSTVEKVLALATADINGLGATNGAFGVTPPVGNYLVDWQVSNAAATDISDVQNYINKDGALVGVSQRTIPSGVADTAVSQSGSTYVSCNGSNVISLRTLMVGTGALTSTGSMRLTAV